MLLNFVHHVCIKDNFSMFTPMKLLTNQQCDPWTVVMYVQTHYELLGSELKNYS